MMMPSTMGSRTTAEIMRSARFETGFFSVFCLLSDSGIKQTVWLDPEMKDNPDK